MAITKIKRHRAALALGLCLLGALPLAALSGCQPTVVPHGNVVQKADLARITPGVTTKDEVARILGSPSMQATFDADRWYYVAQQTEARSFFDNHVAAQDVVAIDFDAAGTVAAVNQKDIENAHSIDPVADATPTLGNEVSLIEQLIGNIGRFDGGEGTGGAPPTPGIPR